MWYIPCIRCCIISDHCWRTPELYVSMHIYWELLKHVLEEFWFLQTAVITVVTLSPPSVGRWKSVGGYLFWSSWVTGRDPMAFSVDFLHGGWRNQVICPREAVLNGMRFKVAKMGCWWADSVSTMHLAAREASVLLVPMAKIPDSLWKKTLIRESSELAKRGWGVSC